MGSLQENIPVLSTREKRLLMLGNFHHSRFLKPGSLLMEIQPSGFKNPLFLVGGFKELAQYLGSEQPLYGLPCSSLYISQEPTSYIKALAAHYVHEIRTVQPDEPYLLGGYCFGGIIAFEMAQELQAQGQKVTLLVLIDTPRPGQGKLERLSRQFIGRLMQMTPTEQVVYILKQIRGVKNKVVSQSIQNNYDEGGNKVYKRSLAVQSYVPQKYPGQITLFFGSESHMRSFLYPLAGWGKLTVGGLRVHIVPGEHHTIIKEPNIQVLAQQLKACIDEAHAQYQ